jgi:hypothetical protein
LNEDDDMPGEQHGVLDTVAQAAAKLWPGLAGALVALRWLPVESSRMDRAIAAVGGFAAASNIGPALAEVSGVASVRVEAGIVFAVGLFGMALAGEVIRALKDAQLGAIIGDWLRRLLGGRNG